MLRVTPADGGAEVTLVEPAFEWEHIPLAMPMDTRDMPVAWDELEHGATVNVGNPHIVFFVPEADAVALGELCPRIETHPLFPRSDDPRVRTESARTFSSRVMPAPF